VYRLYSREEGELDYRECYRSVSELLHDPRGTAHGEQDIYFRWRVPHVRACFPRFSA
jgi:hypothetical protein